MEGVTLSVAANSYAQAYAVKYGYAYVVRGTANQEALDRVLENLNVEAVKDELAMFQEAFRMENAKDSR